MNNITSIARPIRNIMRKDEGVDGDVYSDEWLIYTH